VSFKPPSGGGGSPGGADTNVQYNDGGSFGGEAAFTYNKTTDTLTAVNMAAAFTGNLTGNADTVTNATLTTALTVDTGTLTLTANVANTSVLTIGAGASSVSGANTGDQTNVTGTSATVTGATQAAITTCAALTTSGALAAGSIASGFGTIATGNSITGSVLVATGTASLTLGTASSATGQIILQDAGGANTVTIQPGASAASVTYTWPTNVGGAGTQLTDAAGNGTLSWAAAGGGTLQQAFDAGQTITIADNDNQTLLITNNDTTSDQDTLQIVVPDGQAGKMIWLDHNDTGAGVALDIDSESATGNAININVATTTGDGGAINIVGNNLSTGSLVKIYSNTVADGGELLWIHNDNEASGDQTTLLVTQDGGKTAVRVEQNRDFDGIFVDTDATTQDGIFINARDLVVGNAAVFDSDSDDITSGRVLHCLLNPNNITADKTGEAAFIEVSRTNTAAAARSDDFDALSVKRTNVNTNGGGSLTTAGSVLRLENIRTESAGTVTDTIIPLEIANNAVVDTNFTLIAKYGTVQVFVSDGTSPNTNLTGVQGDICYGADGGKAYSCTTTGTTWTAF